MLELVGLVVTGAAALGGYWKSRHFVRTRLRFVDKVYRRGAPLVAGTLAALVAAPIVWLLPVVGAATAFLFGAGVALGVRSGVRDLKRLPGA